MSTFPSSRHAFTVVFVCVADLFACGVEGLRVLREWLKTLYVRSWVLSHIIAFILLFRRVANTLDCRFQLRMSVEKEGQESENAEYFISFRYISFFANFLKWEWMTKQFEVCLCNHPCFHHYETHSHLCTCVIWWFETLNTETTYTVDVYTFWVSKYYLWVAYWHISGLAKHTPIVMGFMKRTGSFFAFNLYSSFKQTSILFLNWNWVAKVSCVSFSTSLPFLASTVPQMRMLLLATRQH